MSFYESLDVFVGAGVMASATAFGCPMPEGAVAAGSGLSRFLRDRGEGGRFGEILDRLAQEVWLSRDTHGIPVELAEKHATALVGILEKVRPQPDKIVAAINAPIEQKTQAATAAAVDIVARAHQADMFRAGGLLDHVALFLLERLFVQLTTDSALLQNLVPMISAYGAGSASATAPAGSEPAPAAASGPPLAAAALAPAPVPVQQPLATQSATNAIQERYDISPAAMRRFVSILDSQQLKPEARAGRLEELAVWLQVTTAQLVKPSNDDPQVKRLKTEAAEALAAGEFERAMDLLKEVRSTIRGLRRRTQERLEDEIHQLKIQQIEEAAACARLAELAFARGEYDVASELFAEAADSVPTSEPLLRLNYALRQADTLYRQGDCTDDDVALSAAAEHYRRALAAAEQHKNRELVVAARCALGETLSRVSRKSGRSDALREAVKTWQAALALMDRTREPRRVATVLSALGDAFFRIGERDGDEACFDESVAAYAEAETLLDSGGSPLDWALVQLGRGTGLLHIAEREGKDRLWLEAASTLVPALEVLEAQGLGEVGRHARESLRSFHANWARMLGRPSDVSTDPNLSPGARRTGTLH